MNWLWQCRDLLEHGPSAQEPVELVLGLRLNLRVHGPLLLGEDQPRELDDLLWEVDERFAIELRVLHAAEQAGAEDGL